MQIYAISIDFVVLNDEKHKICDNDFFRKLLTYSK